MTSTELKATLSITTIYMLRMLGLFMVLPLFTPYAKTLTGTTPVLIGLALGIYGLTQGLLQIPFGLISDRIGRKPVIATGLLIFAVGSAIAANAHHIVTLLIGRALQGAGAIGSTLMALVADLTRVQQRTKAMAIIGAGIGLSFALALVIGPLLHHWLSIGNIFWLATAFGLIAVILLFVLVPTPARHDCQPDAETVPKLIGKVIKQVELLRLDWGIFCQHGIMTANFVVLPVLLKDLGIATAQQWWLYLPILAGSFLLIMPLVLLAERRQATRTVFLSGIIFIILGEVLLGWQHTLPMTILALSIFFIGFNSLEALLPSLVSKQADEGCKGTAMGLYSTAQFLGIFCGASLGGWLYGHHHLTGVFIMNALLATSWLVIAYRMKLPKSTNTSQPI